MKSFSSSKQRTNTFSQSLEDTGVFLLGVTKVLTAFAISCKVSPSPKMSFSVNGEGSEASGITSRRACQ